MLLERKILARKYYGYHTKVNIGTASNVINYLEELINYLNNYDFNSDANFELCGRKKYVADEINSIINKDEISYETVYFILGSLEEFMCNNNHISMGEYEVNPFTELRDKNDEYIKTGVICKEEKECIEKVIQEIKEYIERNSKNDTHEEVEKIMNTIKELPIGTETSVTKLIGKGALYKYTTQELFEINKEFIKRCEEENIILDYSKYKDMYVGLPFNIDFIKR